MKKLITLVIIIILLLVVIFFIYKNADLNKISPAENYPTNKEENKMSQKFSGSWISLDDESLTREFSEDLTYKDFYNGEMISSGVWYVFDSKNKPSEFVYNVEDGAEYLVLASTNSSTSFKVETVTVESLSLINLNSNLVSNFRKQ